MVRVSRCSDYQFSGSPPRDAFVLHHDGAWRKVRGRKRRLRAPSLLITGESAADVIQWLQTKRNEFGRRDTHSVCLALKWVSIHGVCISLCATTSGHSPGLAELDSVLEDHRRQFLDGTFHIAPIDDFISASKYSVWTDMDESIKHEMDLEVMKELESTSSHA